jgi:hypothetical protein
VCLFVKLGCMYGTLSVSLAVCLYMLSYNQCILKLVCDVVVWLSSGAFAATLSIRHLLGDVVGHTLLSTHCYVHVRFRWERFANLHMFGVGYLSFGKNLCVILHDLCRPCCGFLYQSLIVVSSVSHECPVIQVMVYARSMTVSIYGSLFLYGLLCEFVRDVVFHRVYI